MNFVNQIWLTQEQLRASAPLRHWTSSRTHNSYSEWRLRCSGSHQELQIFIAADKLLSKWWTMLKNLQKQYSIYQFSKGNEFVVYLIHMLRYVIIIKIKCHCHQRHPHRYRRRRLLGRLIYFRMPCEKIHFIQLWSVTWYKTIYNFISYLVYDHDHDQNEQIQLHGVFYNSGLVLLPRPCEYI